MEQIARDPRANFLAVYNANVNRREGAVAMLKWLERETDFFTAPASSKNHLAQPGGLTIHSLNVWRRLREITVRDMTDRNAPGVRQLSEAEEETVAILGLLHDVCKAGVYHQETKRRKNQETGKWEDYLGYTFRDPFPLGHGEKSLFLITRHMALTEEEALAVAPADEVREQWVSEDKDGNDQYFKYVPGSGFATTDENGRWEFMACGE